MILIILTVDADVTVASRKAFLLWSYLGESCYIGICGDSILVNFAVDFVVVNLYICFVKLDLGELVVTIYIKVLPEVI